LGLVWLGGGVGSGATSRAEVIILLALIRQWNYYA
jgi:hypothetical protein